MAGAIIGYDLNESYCQISYYSDKQYPDLAAVSCRMITLMLYII